MQSALFFFFPHSGHAKEALDLARMQEQSTQMEYQSKMKVPQNNTPQFKRSSAHPQTLSTKIFSQTFHSNLKPVLTAAYALAD